MRNTSILLGLSFAVIVSAGCSMSRDVVTADNLCPPRATIVATTPSTPTLAAGGRGVAPREVPPVIDAGVAPASEPHLASGGRGVSPRMEASAPFGGAGTAPTPHLVAMPRGSGGPRVECR
jgi:hypothetical protein